MKSSEYFGMNNISFKAFRKNSQVRGTCCSLR